MTAPTEEDIRATMARFMDAQLPDPWAYACNLVGPVDYIPDDERGNHTNRVWDNLGPTEQARYAELINGIYDLAATEFEAIEKRLLEATVAACLTFAAEHPDAPRAKRAVPA